MDKNNISSNIFASDVALTSSPSSNDSKMSLNKEIKVNNIRIIEEGFAGVGPFKVDLQLKNPVNELSDGKIELMLLITKFKFNTEFILYTKTSYVTSVAQTSESSDLRNLLRSELMQVVSNKLNSPEVEALVEYLYESLLPLISRPIYRNGDLLN